MPDDARRVRPSPSPFARNASITAETVTKLEGHAEGAPDRPLKIKPLLAGESMLFMEATRPQGLVDPEHAHPDHESICYLVSGRMRVVIDGESWIAEPGDAWVHAPGVKHYHEALEDSVQIEIKSPPTKTWG